MNCPNCTTPVAQPHPGCLLHDLGIRGAGPAKDDLVRGLQQHGREYNLPADWYANLLDDINIDSLPAGACMRDHSILTINPKA